MALSKITTNSLAANAVTSAAIANGEISIVDLANQSIGTDQIVDGAITGVKIGLTAINANNIVDGTITTSKVDSNIATISGSQTLTNKTLTAPNVSALNLTSSVTETIYTLPASGSIGLDPANGTIQLCTLSGNPTFTDSLSAGQTLVLMLNGGASYTVTWPSTTWATSAGNTAPTLTANDTLVFWKISSTLYGAYVGSYA